MDKQKLKGLKIRSLTLKDDLSKVAELIYVSDNYIYPFLFNNDLDIGKKVLSNMISSDTIYNYKNIKVITYLGQIIGALVFKAVPISINMDAMKECFKKAGCVIDDRFDRTYKEYFKPLEQEKPDIYFANLAIDQNYRGMGAGRKLLTSLLDDKFDINLEVVKNNTPAFNLYKSVGFEINYEYPGFTGVACYSMTRHKSK